MNTEMKVVEELLFKINEIISKNNIIQKKRYERGDLFNTFNIIGLWSEEVRLHSAFIAELLNPSGSHGLNDTFLHDFCSLIKFNDFPSKNATVEKEKSIGFISEDYREGGRIDIYIESEDKNYAIIIENKIYAEDQHFQLLRYKNFIEKKGISPQKYMILYLTLDGHSPTSASNNKKKENNRIYWQEISYADLIKKWVENCILNAARYPLVRESLTQYLDLIKQLTNQSMEISMNKEIVNLLIQGNNLEAAEVLSNEIINAKQEIVDTKLNPLLNNLAKEKKLILQKSNKWYEKWNKFCFYKEEWKLKYNICIAFSFEGKDFQYFFYGITRIDDNISWNETLIKDIEKIDGKAESTYTWPWSKEVEDIPYNNSFPTECFTKPEKFIKKIENCLDYIIPQTDIVLNKM